MKPTPVTYKNNLNILKNESSVDSQVVGKTAYVGFVKKDRTFFNGGFVKQDFPSREDAKRDASALARALSDKTGVQLHPSVPSDRYKKHTSQTIGAAQSKVMFDMEQRERNPNDNASLSFVSAVIVMACIGASVLAMGLTSLGAH